MIAFTFTALLLLSGIAAAEATYSDATNAYNAANNAIGAAIEAGKDITAADAKLAEARSKITSGEYDAAVTLANAAKALAETAPSTGGSQTTPPANTTNSTQQTGTGQQTGNQSSAGQQIIPQDTGQQTGAPEATPIQGTPEPAAGTGPNWLLIAIVFGAAGLGTVVFLGLAWFFFLRKRY